ncbi:disulfide bond formation protein B [Streptomyces sp. NBC_00239]|uniref:disulfide bond formation protein B n=1 Tax=Streptomyces sp. NBC_00239 TaxID=2903640 RepID=UPI002E2B6611|nr:disulfide bond formation protein B [Streptomyces sp. NBC_00239]
MNSILPDASPMAGGLLGRVQYWFACFFAFGWTGVVCGGLYYQFVEWEYPCPLCIAQRMFMLLAAIGAGVIIRRGMNGSVSGRDYMMGWGLALVAVVAGSFASWRQTMLHILPGDKGYGSEVFGLHLYVWAWILFTASVVAVGVVMAFAHATAGRSVPASYRLPGQLVLGFLALVIAVNVVAVFFEEGFHWFLPDDPSRYELLYDLGILD